MRLVDADELDVYFEKRMVYEAHRNHAYLKGVRDCRKDLANAPTIDAEPIRCNKCKWWEDSDGEWGRCRVPQKPRQDIGDIPIRYRPRDYYCADGERKEDESTS